MGTYAGASRRLAGLTWGAAEDLSAISARKPTAWRTGPTRTPTGSRAAFCLMGAAAGGTAAIDSVYTNFRDLEGLKAEAEAARRDGFAAKMAIHPAQVAPINAVFTPSPETVGARPPHRRPLRGEPGPRRRGPRRRDARHAPSAPGRAHPRAGPGGRGGLRGQPFGFPSSKFPRPRPGDGESRVAPVRLADGARQPFRSGRQEQVDVVRHQAIGRADHAVGAATLRHQVAVERVAAFLGEQSLPPVAALRDMVRQAAR